MSPSTAPSSGAPLGLASSVWARLALATVGGLWGALAFPLAVGSTQELFGSGILEPLAFVSLAPVLLATRGLSVRRAAAVGLWAGVVFFTAVHWWVNTAMTTFGGISHWIAIPATELLAGYGALHWALAFGVVRYLERAHGWSPAWTLGPAWMATELLRNYFLSGFPWANLGYSQARNLWLLQLASIGGVYLIAGLIAAVNGVLYEVLRWAWLRERAPPKALMGGAVAALVLVHAYGALRVWRWDERLAGADKVKVAVVQGNIDQKLKNMQGSHRGMVLRAYNPPTVAADAAGADLIVWPEAAFPGTFEKGTRAISPRAGLSKTAYRAHLLLGVDVFDRSKGRDGFENAAYVVSPTLDVLHQYTKYHLVPFGEYVPLNLHKHLGIENVVPGTFVPGAELRPLPVSLPDPNRPDAVRSVDVGILICFDAIFPEISRSFARDGAELLVNLTNDAWYGYSSAPHQFLRMVALRAVETGRPVARAANTGISGFIDPLGRVRNTTPLGMVKGDAVGVDAALKVPSEWRLDELPVVHGNTPYVVIGDALAYLAALFAVGGVGWGVWRERSQRGAVG